ncbi:MAG: hypothetical protein WCP71_00510 [Actinomycetes bacterium]
MASARAGFDYLKLKSGVELAPTAAGFRLGLPTHGLLLSSSVQAQMARNFDGRRSLQEIAHGLVCDISMVTEFADLLAGQGFVEERSHPIAPVSGDLSEAVISTRREIEQALLTHRAGVSDGGEGEFSDRAAMTILISGENRLARNLLPALQASGFTNTRLISRAHIPPRITSADICGIVARNSDIGKTRRDFTEDLIREARITRTEQVAKAHPDLIISTGPIEWDYVQRWLSEGSPHLHINPAIGREIEVGPVVLPGVTPCLRCVTLTKRDNGSSSRYEFIRSELPSAAAAYLSGLIALAIGEYCATGLTPLRAASHWYDLLEPLRPPDIRHWNFHPECGCQ